MMDPTEQWDGTAEHTALPEGGFQVAQESFAEACARLRREGPKSRLDSTEIIRGFRDRNWKLP
jgi:hypothetical protein